MELLIDPLDLRNYKNIYNLLNEPNLPEEVTVFESHLGGLFIGDPNQNYYCETCGDYDSQIATFNIKRDIPKLEEKIKELTKLRDHLMKFHNGGFIDDEKIFESLGMEYKGDRCPANIDCKMPKFLNINEMYQMLKDDRIPLECKACSLNDAIFYLE